ncbi:PREDICTED: snurportin-1 [Trachymyrmex cornetzi]|uniref:Snurportin-1 n=1 Tax=Trachymyrmex cornetzi TaxID=471704 RepID=A0A195D8Z2_9HYME|nr:PREDICTED: snurportin-1 [Trachymyrmex cornetzi]KYN08889.1 Snurportin-1 [Trachymyrmex cornetzi]
MAELSSSNKGDNDKTNDKSGQETQCLDANNVNDDKSDNLNDDKNDSINDDKSVNINDEKSDNIHDDKSNNINDDKSDNINDDKNNTTNNNKNNCDPRESTRRQFYKSRIRKDNIKLELDDSTPQEERRRLLLEHQKKHRDETINAIRGIQECSTSKNDDMDEEKYIDGEEHIGEEEYIDEEYMDAEEYMDEEEYMEVEDYASSYYKILPNESKTSRMMLSEWMLDVPQDLIENWIMVPCPIGKRVRLISGWGETRAYSRKGVLHGVFPSALPGGNPDSDFHHSTAIDCLWIKNRKLFYILDVLYWSLLPFTNCQAEFRFFWIKNKFQEIPELEERNTDANRYPILTLPNINCNSDLSSALANLDNERPLDGLLFYHRQALYTYGLTPLVTWLKPFMLSEVLGISVPSFDEKPNDYINFEHHIQKIKTKKNRQDNTTKSDTNSMEIEGVV